MDLFYIYAAYDIVSFRIANCNRLQSLFNSLSCVNAICGKLINDIGYIII